MHRTERDRLSARNLIRSYWHHLLYISTVLITAVPMLKARLSDDQITYWSKAGSAMEKGGMAGWDPTSSFSYLLSAAHHLTQDKNASFALIYSITALIYLYAMRRSVLFFVGNTTAATLVSIVSLVPHYTLGMTYWGFAGFEFVKARILIMPFAPIIISGYFRWLKTSHVWKAFILCGFACLLNLEAAYLGAILALYYFLFVIGDKSVLLRSKLMGLAGAIVLSLVIGGIYVWIVTFSVESTLFELPIYEHLTSVVGDRLNQLDDAAYLRLRWQAAREAFWWAMFPPRWTDLGMFVGEHMLILIAALCGAAMMRRLERERFRQLLRFCFCVLIVAYGYQVLRFVLGLTIHWPPDIREEVRAFKFLIFPFMIWTAYLAGHTIQKRRIGLLILMISALLISPVQLIRSAPDRLKAGLVQAGHQYLSDEKLAYVEKLVEYRDIPRDLDITAINRVLSGRASDGTSQYVMTVEHQIKLSGLKTLVSYQDKRAGLQKVFFDDRADRADYLAVWSYAYSEIRSAVHSKDAERLMATADKYTCRYVVTRSKFVHPRLRPLYEGPALSCYEVLPSDGIDAVAR